MFRHLSNRYLGSSINANGSHIEPSAQGSPLRATGERSPLPLVWLVLVFGLGVFGAHADETGASPVSVERRAYLMGTTCTVTLVAGSRPEGLAAAEAAFAAIAQTEDQLSTWRDDTVLARLNRSTIDTPFRVAPNLYRLLERLEEFRDSTGGAFDPASGHLLEAWDVRGAGRTPSSKDRARAAAASGMDLLRLEEATSTVTRLAPGPRMDAGAFGKGEALARASEALRDRGFSRWSIDFGGQVVVGPDSIDGMVSIADPNRRDRAVGRLRLRGLSAATSTQSERPGHIIDPRTGDRAPAFGSVTVVSTDPLVADALSTALFVLGPDAGLALAGEHPDLEALYLLKAPDGLRARMTPGMGELLLELDIPIALNNDALSGKEL